MLIAIIQPQKISPQTILTEIAKVIGTTVQNIKKLEYWPYQIWVNITGKGGRLVSYRSLSPWLREIIIAIRNCTSLEELFALGNIFKQEIQRLPQYYGTEDVEKMRAVWSEQRDYLIAEEERTQPMREYQKKAQEWLETWQKMIAHCPSVDSLQYLYPEMERQSKEFEDLPQIIEELLESFQQRWKKLEVHQKSKVKSQK